MPELEKLEQFNQELITHGDEPTHAMRRGEEIERPLTPEEYPLFNRPTGTRTNKTESDDAADSPAPSGGAKKTGGAPVDDFLSLLQGEGGDAPKASGTSGAVESSGFDDLFDSDLLSGLPGKSSAAPVADNDAIPSFDDLFDTGTFDLGDTGKTGASADDGLDVFGGGLELDDLDTPAENAGAGDETAAAEGDSSEESEEDDFLSGFTDDFIHNTPEDGYDPGASRPDTDDLLGSVAERADDSAVDAGAGSDIPDIPDMDFGSDFGGLPDFDADSTDTDEPFAAEELPAEELPADAGSAAESFGLDDFADLDSMGGFGDLDGAGDASHPLDDSNEFHIASEQFDASSLSSGDDLVAAGAGPAVPPEMPADFGANMDMDFGTESFSDEFDMSDFGKDFGLMEEIHEEAWTAPAAPTVETEAPKGAGKKSTLVEEAEEEIQKATLHEQAAAFDIGPENLARIQQSLAAMPLNLKIATEEVLGNEDADFESLKNLIRLLVRGESPRDIAPVVSRISGKKIKIPAGYEKKTGTAFEQEKRSFVYQFKQVILPVLRMILLFGALAAILIYAGYEFIYKPLYGNNLYDQGLAAIDLDEYEQGNELFERAWEYWPDENRYVQYAQAFRHKRQDALAVRKYQELLGRVDPKDKPFGVNRMHREGLLDYSDFLAWTRMDYSTAVTYLQRLVDEDKFDHVPVMMQGDVFLEWARYVLPGGEVSIIYSDKVQKAGDQTELLEAARYNYASLISREGQTDELLSRMLRYFMRTGKEEEVTKIKNLFLEDPKARPDGAVTAELAGFLIDAAEGSLKAMEEPSRLVLKSLKAGFEQEPGLHYQLARYYRALGDETEENKALDWALKTFDARAEQRPLDRFEQIQHIDTLIRKGECLYGPLYSEQDVMGSQARLQKARDLYEGSLKTGHIPHEIPLLGRVYARLGDILYYNAGDLGGAWRQYSIARKHDYGVASPDAMVQVMPEKPSFLDRADAGVPHLSISELLDANQDIAYKMGFIHYYLSWTQKPRSREQGINQDLALSEFMQAAGPIPLHNLNLQYALSNIQYMRGNYDAAVSGYQEILERLQLERDTIPELEIYDNASHRELVEFLVRTHNNLGVSMFKLYLQGGPSGSEYRGQALYHLGRAIEIYENSARDPDTALRPERKSQAFQNLGAMLQHSTENDLSISWELRRDLSQSKFSRDLMTIDEKSNRSQTLFN